MKINLLPTEIKERQRVRRQAVAVGLIGAILVVAVAGLFVLQQIRLNSVEDDLATQEATNVGLQQQINELQRFDLLQAEAQGTRALLDVLLVNEVLWSGVLRDISLVIPGTDWLTALTGSLTAEGAAEGAELVAGGLVGTINFTGNGLDMRSVSLWLTRLEDVKGFVNPWLTNAQKTMVGETREVVQFTSSVDLSQDAVARGRRR